MNIIKKISSSLLLNPVDKPTLLESFYPLPFEKYITIFNDYSDNNNTYDLFDDFVSFLKEEIDEQNIKIIQILNSNLDKKIKNCLYIERFNLPQLTYILSNSLLHICSDEFTNEIAIIKNVPSIYLCSQNFTVNTYSPYFNGDINKVLVGDFYDKPPFSKIQNPKSINSIKTENIINKAFYLLKIKKRSTIKTHFIGDFYLSKNESHVIPDHNINYIPHDHESIFIRLDIENNELNCYNFCSNFKHSLVVKKIPSLSFLKSIKDKCEFIYIFCEDDSCKSLIQEISNLGFKIKIYPDRIESNNKLKLKFIEFEFYEQFSDNFNKKIFKNKTLFKSSRKFISENAVYSSLYNYNRKIESNKYVKEMLSEIDFFKLYDS